MNINRHNYEEYFLLYVDNELKQDERMEVESFIEQHPDLKGELDMLQQTVLGIEEVEFGAKGLLYKKEEGINVANYEEFFLLHVDNELDGQQKVEVEKFVLKHPELQDEFTVLHQTKLEPEVLEFKNKEVLYREEAKVRRLVPVMWLRIAAAAAIIGLVAFTWFFKQDSRTVDQYRVVAEAKKATQTVTPPNIESRTAAPDKGLSDENADKALALNRDEAVASSGKKVTLKDNKDEKRLIAKTTQARRAIPGTEKESVESRKEMIETPANKMASNNLPVPERRIEKPESNENSDTYSKREIIDRAGSVARTASNRDDFDQQPKISNAVYKEVDTNDDDRSVYIGGASINKNKIKAIFKKAAGFFGKNVDKNDDPAVARVANFEIKGK